MKKLLFIFVLTLVTITSNAQASPRGDIDNDGVASVLTCPDNHHPHLIDLGLPSGTKWACCNVGADKPEAYGGYYAWGEVNEKARYDHDTYFRIDNSEVTNNVLSTDIAGTQYDVAHVKWGGSWVMPSLVQIDELVNKCTYTWTSKNGVEGGILTGPSGGKIFLPAAGYRRDTGLYDAGSFDYYRSSAQSSTLTGNDSFLYFDSDGTCRKNDLYGFYYYGYAVRPVSR